MESVFHEARKIQASILPRRVPDYGRFDIAGRSRADGTGGRRLLRLHPGHRQDPGTRDRRRLGPRPARGAPGARHLHGPAHGPGARLQDRAHRRAAEQHHPPEHADQPLRVDVLRRARAQRRLHLRQRRPSAAVPPRRRRRRCGQVPRGGRPGARAARRRHLRARLRDPGAGRPAGALHRRHPRDRKSAEEGHARGVRHRSTDRGGARPPRSTGGARS